MIEVKKRILSLAEIFFTPLLYSNVLASLILLYFYAFFFSYLLPVGINQYFTQRIVGLLPIPMAILYFIVLYFYRKNLKAYYNINDYQSLFSIKDLPLLLLPMTPILRYILLNLDILTFSQSALIFLTFFTIAFILTFIIPLFFRIIGSKTFLIMTGLSFSFVLFNMATIASDLNWHQTGSLRIQLPILLFLTFVLIIIYNKDRKFLNAAVIIFFIAGLIFTSITAIGTRDAFEESSLYEMIVDREPVFRPDILLLVYESYVENETMLQFGIDNSYQEEFLINNGFYIYSGTWTIGTPTLESMGPLLDVSQTPRGRQATSGNGLVQNILKGIGYEIHGIFCHDWLFLGIEPSYDYLFPAYNAVLPANIRLFKQIFEGEFRFDAEIDRFDYSDYLLEKRSALAGTGSSPVFLYTHNHYPSHSQFSGRCLGNEVEIYKEGLAIANKEMQEDVMIAIMNNPEAIIIVCGDHGPFLTKNCYATGHQNQYEKSEINRLDIQARYGSFLAIKWPSKANINHKKIEILQDIFPVIFAWMYDDQSILDSRLEQITINSDWATSGVLVRNGVIEGGVDDGRLLFDSMDFISIR